MKEIAVGFLAVLAFVVAPSPQSLAAAPTAKPVVAPAGSGKTAPVIMTESKKNIRQEYLLPFPGILPDHPLYVLKQIRDGIMDRLIVDPLRKADFLVLQADKRLNMGKVLLGQGKAVLAEQVVSKGEKYMERAVSGLAAYKSLGRPVPAATTDKLTRSMEKHVEELTALIADTGGSAAASGLAGSLEFVKKLQADIEKLK